MSGSLSAGEIRRRCDALAQAVLGWCGSRGVRIAAAESLTGGLLADAFVRIPGASRVFLGSAVTYDIAAKASVLGVDADLLRREGAVHPDVARQMALGTARLYDQPAYGDGSSDCPPPVWPVRGRTGTSPPDWCMWGFRYHRSMPGTARGPRRRCG